MPGRRAGAGRQTHHSTLELLDVALADDKQALGSLETVGMERLVEVRKMLTRNYDRHLGTFGVGAKVRAQVPDTRMRRELQHEGLCTDPFDQHA